MSQVLTGLDLKYETVLDGFGGTGTVSYLFKKLGKTVTYNDLLKFNHIIGKGLIENDYDLLSENDLVNLTNYISERKIVERNFQGIFYLDDENQWIDNLTEGITELFGDQQHKQALAYYALFQACLIKRPFNLFHRKNLSLRTNDVVRNFGNKTSWEKPFDSLFKQFSDEANSLVFSNNKMCNSLNSHILDLDEYGYDLVYLDPPYFNLKSGHETSNYHKCYHFLEGLSKYSEWEGLINQDTLIKRLDDHNDINQLTKANISEKMEELLYKFRNSIVVVSYKEGGVPSIEEIVAMFEKLGKKVFSESIHYKYALNHQNGDAANNREVLIIGV